MPAIGVLTLLIQIGFVWHAITNHKQWWWIFVLLSFPGIGIIVYIIVEILPEMRLERTVRLASANLSRVVDPGFDLKQRVEEVAHCDSTGNKLALAEECVRRGFYDDAINIYTNCHPIFKDDPLVLFGLSEAYFFKGEYAKAKEIMKLLLASHPKYRMGVGRALYAEILEKLGDCEEAIAEWQTISNQFSGEEARYRRGLLLKRIGRFAEASQVFEKILANAKNNAKVYQTDNRKWIDLAGQELKQAVADQAPQP